MVRHLLSKKHITAICLAALAAAGCSPDGGGGRKGNALFQEGQFDEAVLAYQSGIERFEDADITQVHSNLLNNQGAAYYRGENHEAAKNAFIKSIAMADDRAEQVRGSYNAGNAAFGSDEKPVSADFFRQALLLDPGNVDAKYNYEFVKRQLKREQQDDQQEQGGNEPPPKPSDYAKELKARADALVAERRYREAHQLMTDGLKSDPTIKAFQTFIDRTASIADIDEGAPASR